MADVKTLLKEARQLINEKHFKEAQEICKNILRKDKSNYMALVLLGVSLQDSDQAPLAFQKAISTKNDRPLAWQGLATYYEKKGDNNKLLGIYEELLKFDLEDEKIHEVISKLGQLASTTKSGKEITIIINLLNKNIKDELKELAKKQLIEILKIEVPFLGENVDSVLKILYNVYETNPDDSLEFLIGKITIQKSDISLALEEVLNMNFFHNNESLKCWLCGFLFKMFVKEDCLECVNLDHLKHVTKGIEDKREARLLECLLDYNKGLYSEAYTKCISLINYQEPDESQAEFIIRCTKMLRNWKMMEKLSKHFLTKIQSVDLMKHLFYSLYKEEKWKEAVLIFKEISALSLTIDEKAAYAECCIEINENIDIEEMKSTEHYAVLKSLSLLKNQKFHDAISVLENETNSALEYLVLGIAYWKSKQYDKTLIMLLKAAKLDPYHPRVFLYLGHYYKIMKDLEKSKKCYEKAYNLNSTDPEICRNLSEIYLSLRDFESNFNLINSSDCNDVWIKMQLGLSYSKKRDWEKAILNFRLVIRSYPNDAVAFECLADSYYSRGSYTSALKAYNKVIELKPTRNIYCRTKIGLINSILTQYEDALNNFYLVIYEEPDNILALKGIAETWMKISKEKFDKNLFGSARDGAQKAVDYTTKALMKSNYSCLWKILTETLMFVTKFPVVYSYIYIRGFLIGIEDDIIKKNRVDLYRLAISCYLQVLKCKKQTVSYDLANAYLLYYREVGDVSICQKAFTIALACIKTKSSWRNWNLLGIIYTETKKYNLAQHCFIKSLLVLKKQANAKVWCNLGTLYLKLGLHRLANYCFWRGQSALPSYPISWIGQGLVAESTREEEAMDLFRHAARLGYHRENALGYADWVCRTICGAGYKNSDYKYAIEFVYAVPYATDLMEWLNYYEPENACAAIITGILKERSGLLKSALSSYEQALNSAPEDKRNIVLLNLGRVLIRLNKYEEAIAIFKSITEASIDSACGLALALSKTGDYEEAYASYNTALHWLSEDEDKAEILVAMAGIIYKFKGITDSKTLLFQSIQVSQKKPSVKSLFATCALGLLHTDQSLSKLALNELKKYEKDQRFSFDIGFLKSYLLVSEGSMQKAVKSLCDSIRNHPDVAKLWLYLAEYCLRAEPPRGCVASICAQKAVCSSDNVNKGRSLALASISENMAGLITNATKLSKIGLHLYPHQAELWASYIFVSNVSVQHKAWLKDLLMIVRRHLQISRSLAHWFGLVERSIQKTM